MIIIYLIIIAIIYLIYTSSESHQKYKYQENFADPYSLRLHAEAVNKQKRWNLYGSRKYSSIRGYIYPPLEYDCYHSLWYVNDRLN